MTSRDGKGSARFRLKFHSKRHKVSTFLHDYTIHTTYQVFLFMAATLRKRLGKCHATPDQKGIANDDVGSTTSSSSGDLSPKLTNTKKQHPTAQDDLSSTSTPLERRLESHALMSSAATSPSQSLLFKYKKRSAAKQALSPLKAGNMTADRVDDVDPVLNKPLHLDHSVTSESTNEPCMPLDELCKETKIVDGVEFEMLDKKRAFEAPARKSGNEESAPQRRQTRSQTRRQERADSHSFEAQSEESPKNRGLTIRTVQDNERMPSPLVDPDAISKASSFSVTPTPTDDPQHQLTPSPQIPTSCTQDPTTCIPKISSYRRSQQAKTIREHIPPTRVMPPMFRPNVPVGYLWVSSLSSSSRPSEPWGWLKKWTCCQCAELDPFGGDEPALTMVEQKVCARLECGHERCALGCRVLPDPRYNVPGVFG